MEINEQSLGVLRELLSNAQSSDNSARKNAENYLNSIATQPRFALLILTFITNNVNNLSSQENALRLGAAVYFKNLVKKHWSHETHGQNNDQNDTPLLSDADKTAIKEQIVDIMTIVPPNIQRQLAEAVTIISKYDFPKKWDNLLPQLVSKLQTNNLMVRKGVLITVNSIMKRFRYVFKSDELYEVLLICLQAFQQELLTKFQENLQLVEQFPNSITELDTLLECQRLLCRIFYSLNWQDIPEYFEDNVTHFMTLFGNCLMYKNPLLIDTDEENEPGPIEKLQTAILENLNLYATKYEEAFEPFLRQFTELIWKLLMEVGPQPKYDQLATNAIKFLTAVGSKKMNIGLFTDGILQDIIQHIVVKNLTASEADEELFEDNPTDYIRKDVEGSDQDTRRKAAMELVRTLMKYFSTKVSQLCVGYIDILLEQYRTTKDWRAKDAALHLVLSCAIQSSSAMSGGATSNISNVGDLNPNVNILGIFDSHVLPEIHDTNINAQGIVKADAIKMVCIFRQHLPVPFILAILPHLIRYLQAKDIVVQTYAAMTIERFLFLKDRDTTTGKLTRPRVTKEDLMPFYQPLLAGLFNILAKASASGMSDNDYAMKCVMRVLLVMGTDIAPILEIIVAPLTKTLEIVAKNPINAHFNHYLFEALALLVKSSCGTGETLTISELQATNCSKLEALLFPTFQIILSQDISELVPYVFQILAQLLTARPVNSGLSDAYRALFPPLLSPVLWERKGNIPGLVDLYKAYISRGMQEIIQQNHLTGVLGVFQKLLASRATEIHAFNVLNAIVMYAPIAVLQPFLVTIFNLLLYRLQDSVKETKTTRYTRLFLHTICLMSAIHSGAIVYDTVESISKGLMTMIIVNVWSHNATLFATSPNYSGMTANGDEELESKMVLIGGTKLLVESNLAIEAITTWQSLFHSLLQLTATMNGDTTTTTTANANANAADEEIHFGNGEDAEFDSHYSKLAYVNIPVHDGCRDVASSPQYFLANLAVFTSRQPGVYPPIMQATMQGNESSIFMTLLQKYGVNIV